VNTLHSLKEQRVLTPGGVSNLAAGFLLGRLVVVHDVQVFRGVGAVQRRQEPARKRLLVNDEVGGELPTRGLRFRRYECVLLKVVIYLFFKN
jgi:hypothetical protein